ncbi:uncharacterized protein LOC119604858 [Lucilia sericata]|uniref:uncharacterized protein LOC119604858 n=1 Tax=Lucilia sericata TaxID=13632 RepID=UPI0018A862B0|nr:uncharacterized protein LOC119604858 [Lucilia sericata]
MSTIRNGIRKRKRENEVKKWTDEDIKKVLCYMQAHRNIEKPTARMYYEKLLEETKLDANWNILKCKVRYLKGTLQKAESWRRKAGVRMENGDGASSVKDKVVQKICPYYEQLSDIFILGKEINYAVLDTSFDEANYISQDATDIKDENHEVSDDAFDNSSHEAIEIKNEIVEENYERFDYNSPLAIDNRDESLATTSPAIAAYKVKPIAQNTSPDKLTAIEVERTKFWEKQLKLETDKFEWAKEVEKKKLEMDRIRLENEFQLKKLELEQNERIKMFEIEMKYKNK